MSAQDQQQGADPNEYTYAGGEYYASAGGAEGGYDGYDYGDYGYSYGQDYQGGADDGTAGYDASQPQSGYNTGDYYANDGNAGAGGNPMNQLNDPSQVNAYQAIPTPANNDLKAVGSRDEEMREMDSVSQANGQQPSVANTQPPAAVNTAAAPAVQNNMSSTEAQHLIINASNPTGLSHQLAKMSGQSPGTAIKDYSPESDGRLADVILGFTFSSGYRLYTMYMLWSSLVLTLFIGYDYSYATLYRMLAPPNRDVTLFGQSICYMCIFFALSFFIVSVICLHVDMMREFWRANRNEPRIWGFKIFAEKAPWPVYSCLIILNLFVPLFWSLGYTLAQGDSFFFFLGHLFYTAQTLSCFVVLIIFIWFWFRAAKEKSAALARRKNSPDDCPAVAQQYLMDADGTPNLLGAETQEQLEKVNKWWKSDRVLEEWGLDQTTVVWQILVWTLCFTPLILICLYVATEGDAGNWDAIWLVVAVVFYCFLMMLHQASVSKKKKFVSTVAALSAVLFFNLVGIIGGAATLTAGPVVTFVILLVLTQGMMTRKRSFQMSRQEIYREFKQPYDMEFEKAREKRSWDDYWNCCKPLTYALCCCCDINKYFGHKHPDVAKKEYEIRKERIALRTDQNILGLFWTSLSFAFLIILAYSRANYEWFGARQFISETANPSGDGSVLNSAAFCTSTIEGLSLYEYSLLAMMASSNRNEGITDWSVWFAASQPTMTLEPRYSAVEAGQLESKNWALWYQAILPSGSTAHNYFIVQSISKEANWMSFLDMWGDSLALQMAGALAPHILAWPQPQKASWVNGVAFLKAAYGGNNATEGLENYLQSTEVQGNKVIVGHGHAGGLAQLVAAKLGLKAVTFDAPGIGYLQEKFSLPANPVTSAEVQKNIVDISTSGNLFSMVDSKAGVGLRQEVSCADSSDLKCTSMVNIVRQLYSICGDKYGRKLKDVLP